MGSPISAVSFSDVALPVAWTLSTRTTTAVNQAIRVVSDPRQGITVATKSPVESIETASV